MFKRLITIVLLSLVIVGCGSSNTGSSNQTPTPTDTTFATVVPSRTPSPTAALTPIPPHATGVIIAVSPDSFSSVSCGTTTSVTFNAIITVNSGSTGGPMPFTWNINHTNIAGSVNFASGETSKTVTYTLNNYSLQLNSSPLTGTITVDNPGSTITSSAVGPTGTCRLPGPFLVQSIALSVSPTTITGITCGTTITVTYTATITIAPDSNAGSVQLVWSIGTYTPKRSLFFAPAQTIATAFYSETGRLVAGNTNGFPHHVMLASTSPNAVASAIIKPTGLCK